MVLRCLQRQVSLLLTATLTVLNGKDMASSYISQKGQRQQITQNAELTSKLVSLDSSISQMIYILSVVYTGYPVLRSLTSLSHLKLSTVHRFKTPPNLPPSALLLPSAHRQNSHTNSKCWRRENLYQRVPMAAFKSLSSHSLESVFSRDFSHFRATAVLCTTSKRMSMNGMSSLLLHQICNHS